MFKATNKNYRITLIVTGSIAAYKSAQLVRDLVALGHKVHVVMSSAAREFITPLTLQTVSGNRVTVDFFDLATEAEIGHIRLADEADLVLVAPASADFIAKASIGRAEDVATAVLLATRAPVIFAPAMNVNMWEHALTRKNVEELKRIGYHFVEPDSGELACGCIGKGRLAENSAIIEKIYRVLSQKILIDTRVIVTAGPTQEAIDPVRYISNRSSGKMGYALAYAANCFGAEVVLISGPSELTPPNEIEFYKIRNATEMREILIREVSKVGKYSEQYIFMAAAVADHRAETIAEKKIKLSKESSYQLTLVPNPDILEELGKTRKEIEQKSGIKTNLIGFAAETGEKDWVIKCAKEKLARKNVDVIVGNSAEQVLDADDSQVWLVDRHLVTELPYGSKLSVAEAIIKHCVNLKK